MKKLNTYLCFGLFFNGLWILSNRFGLLPDFVEGFCVGLGITLLLAGMYHEGHNLSKFKNYKKKLFNRI